jgi:hypothetical protein
VRPAAIHVGACYVGGNKQVRRVLRISDTGNLLYEVVVVGKLLPGHIGTTPDVGDRKVVRLGSFASWAVQEVEDPSSEMGSLAS